MGCGATSGEPLPVHPSTEKEAGPKITVQTSPRPDNRIVKETPMTKSTKSPTNKLKESKSIPKVSNSPAKQ
jgi:hypothetical protein